MKNSYIRFLIISFLSVVAFPLVVLILHTYALFLLVEALVRVHHSLSIFSNNLIFSLLLLLLFSFLTHREYSLWLPFKQPPHHFAGERRTSLLVGEADVCPRHDDSLEGPASLGPVHVEPAGRGGSFRCQLHTTSRPTRSLPSSLIHSPETPLSVPSQVISGVREEIGFG